MCFVSIGEVIIESVSCINCYIDDSAMSLNFVEIRQCIFPFFVRVFMILNMDVRVKCQFICWYPVSCKKKKKVHPIRGHESPHVEWQNSFIH